MNLNEIVLYNLDGSQEFYNFSIQKKFLKFGQCCYIWIRCRSKNWLSCARLVKCQEKLVYASTQVSQSVNQTRLDLELVQILTKPKNSRPNQPTADIGEEIDDRTKSQVRNRNAILINAIQPIRHQPRILAWQMYVQLDGVQVIQILLALQDQFKFILVDFSIND